ncbi:MAG: SDR family NAD(P)-dependent oxidoreductase [Candidatus Hydrogenedentes bacterium]|nr:SDR family NAD(P)-dependent oxidoreductase [Candidatus Hydrogenedentota bacterium]
MSSPLAWPDFSALTTPMDQLVALSRYYGTDPSFVIAGGGNTSVKIGNRLQVKGSGSSLADITEKGFVEMDRDALDALLKSELSSDIDTREAQFKDAVMAARLHPELGQRPSVECVLHNLMPGTFVVHTHSTIVNMITCAKGGQDIAAKLFGDRVLWLPYVTPGFILSKALFDAMAEYTSRTGKAEPEAVFMGNHGLIISGETPAEIKEKTDRVIATIETALGELSPVPFGVISMLKDEHARNLINIIGPTLRGLLSDSPALKVVTFDDSEIVKAFVGGVNGQETAAGGPMIPDQIVYCKSFPLWVACDPTASEAETATYLRNAVATHTEQTHFAPLVILVQGLGMFTVGDTYKDAATVRDIYIDDIKIMAGARQFSAVEYMTKVDRDFIENWEVENYRRKVASAGRAKGQVEGKIAVVTGAAQGFGLEIAKGLAAEGAHVVLADINAAGTQTAAEGVAKEFGAGRALGFAMNVTDGASIAEALHQVVRNYGGFDLFVANAGVLKAGSVKVLPEADFDFVTNVNYKGYFLCVQNAAPIMARQHRAKPSYLSDIVQINSKSGLEGSNKNGAYAGSKFGGIGLTQSFALELVEDGIKVNSVCPGNFFDGPLWSDPEKGLFVQYLNSGKVPGAKTIDDVKHFYEAKVPMRRGCTGPDVLRAIVYLVQQQYETGQALPVTGGQTMLS